MRCARCEYPLEAIGGGVCPECGSAFDPCNPDTFVTPASHAARMHRWLRWTLVLAVAPGVINIVCAGLCWGIATLVLGHPPRPSADDPKNIAGIEIFLAMWYLSIAPAMVFALFIVPLAIALAVQDGPPGMRRRSRWWALACLAIMGFEVYFWFVARGGRVFEWLMD